MKDLMIQMLMKIGEIHGRPLSQNELSGIFTLAIILLSELSSRSYEKFQLKQEGDLIENAGALALEAIKMMAEDKPKTSLGIVMNELKLASEQELSKRGIVFSTNMEYVN